MKNFLRALRFAWPYRRRLALSIACALMAAVFWSLNFTAIYPVLKVLVNKQSLQEWVDDQIAQCQADIDKSQPKLDACSKDFQKLQDLPSTKSVQKQMRDLSTVMAELQSRLDSSTTNRWHYLIAKKYIDLLPTDHFLTLAWVIGLVVVGVAFKGFFDFWQESLVGSVVNLSLFDLRNRFYRNAIHLDVNHFGEEGTHELMARFTNDMEMLGTGTKTLFGKVVAEPLKALGCIMVACWINWQLTLLFLVLVPVALFIVTKVGRVMKRATRRLLERMSSIYKILQETFQGMRVVKAFTMEPYERRRFRNATLDYYHKSMLVVNIDAISDPVIELLGVAAVGVALLAGAYLVLHQENNRLFGLPVSSQPLAPEALIQLYAFLAAIADPVRKLSSVYTRIQSGAAAADRIFTMLDLQPRVRRNSTGPRLRRHQAGIEFRDVCFSYEPDRPILTNLHLRIRFGETVALVGKNGCGKTTLAGLIPRFYDPDHGTILVDDADIRKVNLRSLRQQIGIVTQEAILFDDTIYNNIAYGNRRARPEDVEEVARRAFAHDFILLQSNGYKTRLGEAGGKLSGGQKQRLALARAMLRNPSIFILDEFTSQSDPESEIQINLALKEFIRERTTLIITHRLNTLELADRIVVLDNGRIDSVGTHPELLHSCPAYQRLHEAHFKRLSA